MDIPVYLFTGFMDSGKTSLVTQTLLENDFGVGARTLIIACEDGDEEYDEEKLAAKRATVIGVDSEEDFNAAFLRDCDAAMKPDQVFIEYNGTLEAAKLMEMPLQKGWQIVQVLTTVDASTYELYLQNMRPMMMEQVFASDVVIFNRCTDETPKGKFRRTVKTYNRKAQIVNERDDGTIDQKDMEDLPYDLNQDVI
ncbi:MAG: GTPase, partial [Clostridiales bacterium]|nr:GTPase [Clostridiales bacterium]